MFRTLLAAVCTLTISGFASAAPILITAGLPNGVAPTSPAVTGATVTGFAPIVENFQGFNFPGVLNQANTSPPVALTGTPLGGGTFQIGKPGDGPVNIFANFANTLGNKGVTLQAGPATDPISFLATSAAFTKLGFLLSDFGDPGTNDSLNFKIYADVQGTQLLATLTMPTENVITELIGGTEVAFLGISSDVPFARVDFFSSGGLLNDSIQIDDIRATFVPEPTTLATLGLIAAFGGFAVRRKMQKATVAQA